MLNKPFNNDEVFETMLGHVARMYSFYEDIVTCIDRLKQGCKQAGSVFKAPGILETLEKSQVFFMPHWEFAGQYYANPPTIYSRKEYLSQPGKLTNVFIHEVGHMICDLLTGNPGNNHGRDWEVIMTAGFQMPEHVSWAREGQYDTCAS